MASTKKRPLHVANDMAELKQKCVDDLKRLTTNQSATVLRRALDPLIQQGDKLFNEGDEEFAYIVYMRYAQLAMNEKELNNKELLSRVIGRCEALKKSLDKRYRERGLEKCLDSLPSPPVTAIPKITNGTVNSVITPKTTCIPPPTGEGPVSGPKRSTANGLLGDGQSKGSDGLSSDSVVDDRLLHPITGPYTEQKGPQFVTCAELRTLLSQGRALVLDCRNSEAFDDSRINISSNVINIPKLYMGIASHSIANELSGSAKTLFDRRKEFEKVVIVDWDGRGYLSPGAPAVCLYESLWKWALSEERMACYYLKDGYRFWKEAFPHDTTNSKPREELNKATEVPGGLETGFGPIPGSMAGSGAMNPSGKGSVPSAEQLRNLTWLPKSFETKVTVVQTPAIAPTVASSSGPSGNSQNRPPGAGGDAKGSGPRPTPSADDAGGLRHDGSELGRVDRSSQNTVRQFAQSVNEQISTSGTSKTRTKSEAADCSAPTLQPSFSKPQLLRSRSLDDIYEESPRFVSFDRNAHQPSGSSADQTESSDHHASIKRPSIDRSLKPSSSLDAATVHRGKDGQAVASIGQNHASVGSLTHGSQASSGPRPSVAPSSNTSLGSGPVVGFHGLNNNNEFNQRALIAGRLPTRPPSKPSLPPKTRRSQSPVQVYGFGPTERTSGLRNLGNSCYMNSVLQALAHSTEFAQYFVSRQFEDHLNPSNPRGSRGMLPRYFSQLLSHLWSQNETREPLVQFRNLMGSLYPMYATYDQQDSHEFLVNLLDRLHEDLNRAEQRNRPKSSSNVDTVVTFQMLATELNKFFTAHNDMQLSVVTQNYEGILVSGLKCRTCDKDSYTFQVFNVLSVPIPSVEGVDIFSCFDEFFREENVEDWVCPHCKTKRTAIKSMRIARLPKHLIIHLVRFKNESWTTFSFSSYKKNTNIVRFTDELDTRELAQYVYSKDIKLKSYMLYAVVNHYGTISSGHYYSDCRFQGRTQWYRYSDQQVTSLQGKEPDVGSAYMLFYSCVD